MNVSKKIRVLQINSHTSIATSTGKQVVGLHNYFKTHGIDSFVAYSEDENTFDKHFINYGCKIDKYISALLTRFFSNRYGRGNLSTSKLIRIVNKINPDVVHIHCINCYDVNIYRFLNFLSKKNIPIVITEHAEFFYTGSCSHAFDCKQYETRCTKCPRLFFSTKSFIAMGPKRQWVKMNTAFSKIKRCTIASVSPWLMERSNKSPILNRFRHLCIYNGITEDTISSPVLSSPYGNNYFLFVSSDPKTKNKGITHLFKIASTMPDDIFLIIGKVYNETKKETKLKNIIFAGEIKDPNLLNEIYKNAKATLVLSKVETFSMVVAESLINGTPVFGFKAGGPESISIEQYSFFVDYGDINSLIRKMKDFDYNSVDKNTIRIIARKKFSMNSIAKQYKNLYFDLLSKK